MIKDVVVKYAIHEVLQLKGFFNEESVLRSFEINEECYVNAVDLITHLTAHYKHDESVSFMINVKPSMNGNIVIVFSHELLLNKLLLIEVSVSTVNYNFLDASNPEEVPDVCYEENLEINLNTIKKLTNKLNLLFSHMKH